MVMDFCEAFYGRREDSMLSTIPTRLTGRYIFGADRHLGRSVALKPNTLASQLSITSITNANQISIF